MSQITPPRPYVVIPTSSKLAMLGLQTIANVIGLLGQFDSEVGKGQIENEEVYSFLYPDSLQTAIHAEWFLELVEDRLRSMTLQDIADLSDNIHLEDIALAPQAEVIAIMRSLKNTYGDHVDVFADLQEDDEDIQLIHVFFKEDKKSTEEEHGLAIWRIAQNSYAFQESNDASDFMDLPRINDLDKLIEEVGRWWASKQSTKTN